MCCLQELADEAEVVAQLPEIVLAGQENQTETQVLVDYEDVSVRLTGVGLAAHNWQAHIRKQASVTAAAWSCSTVCCVMACAQLLAASCSSDNP